MSGVLWFSCPSCGFHQPSEIVDEKRALFVVCKRVQCRAKLCVTLAGAVLVPPATPVIVPDLAQKLAPDFEKERRAREAHGAGGSYDSDEGDAVDPWREARVDSVDELLRDVKAAREAMSARVTVSVSSLARVLEVAALYFEEY